MATLCERDFIAWTESMSALLRARDTAGLDWDHAERHLPESTQYTRWPLEKVLDAGFLPK